MFYIGLTVGIFIGFFIGYVTAALMVMAKKEP
jgi:tetrahydromethanopterin S-methyltransferase subunit F